MLTVDRLVKTFPGGTRKGDGAAVRAVDNVAFEVAEGQLFTLLGPSGCGKTTTLRLLAGLEQPDSGLVKVGDRTMFSRGMGDPGGISVPANRRGFGMVFQSYAIWPHMSVFDNAAFPLQVRRRSKRLTRRAIRETVLGILETLQLSHLADRPATKLSGGQQQRLALARAIALEPPLMLLDEPLSNLDAKLRESLRFELKRLQQELGITSVYVTHDQTEALAMSSVVAVMQDGKIMQCGTPLEVYRKPSGSFVADFIGTSTFLEGIVASQDERIVCVRTPEGELRVETDHQQQVPAGTSAIVSIRPEVVHLAPESSAEPIANEWRGTVTTRAFLGAVVEYLVQVGDTTIRAQGPGGAMLEPGTPVYLQMSPSELTMVPVSG
ncbi:MAG: ATP-binding cassette domain-containing protein [Micromonosporaceae bacterium]|nr:ATP-binding cassette domain-containing protein [Micromonosporaceae bacterium]